MAPQNLIPVFSLWTAASECAKGYELDGAGVLTKVPARLFTFAEATKTRVATVDDLAELLSALKPGSFITAGTADAEQLDAVRREKDRFPFPSGPGLLILDGDGLEAFGIASAADYVAALRSVEPELQAAGIVTMSSASSYLSWPSGQSGLRGLHAFILLDDARLVPSILASIATKAIAAGYVREKITERGTILIRTLVDLAMKTSNQPCFEGGARLLDERISQKLALEVFPGGVLRSADVAPPNPDCFLAAQKAEDKIRRNAKSAADAQARAWAAARVHVMVASGVEAPEAEMVVAKLGRAQGEKIDLGPSWPIHLDDGRTVTVAEILRSPEAFDGVTCHDPLEPETGRCKAKIYCGKAQHKSVIHSFSRGAETRFFLKAESSLTNLQNFTSSDLSALSDPAHPSADLHETSRSSHHTIDHGELTVASEDGKRQRCIASHARDRLLPYLTGRFAWASRAMSWHTWTGTHWHPEENSAAFDKALHDLVDIGCHPIGFNPAYLRGIADLIKTGGQLPLPEPSQDSLLPFRNGILDLSSQTLIGAQPDFAFSWCIPFDYQPESDCPRIKQWLESAVGNDPEMVEYLRAWLAAILLGRADLQRFLYLKGPGGTGKSTFVRLAEALVGVNNVFITDLKNLENNRFETAGIYGKRLVVVNDASKYGGSVEVLKALTGQDALRIERKHQQQSGTFVFKGIVVATSNEDLVTTDLTSGLDRRRATVSFSRVVSESEKASWQAAGGEEAILHAELPGLVNWLLGLDTETIGQIIRNPPQMAAAENHVAMLANNPVARWLCERAAPSPGTHTQLGVHKEMRGVYGFPVYDGAADSLYPNYLEFCMEEHIHQLAKGRFKATLLETASTLGFPLQQGRVPGNGRASIVGIRLREEGEMLYPWFRDAARKESALKSRLNAEPAIDRDDVSFVMPVQVPVDMCEPATAICAQDQEAA